MKKFYSLFACILLLTQGFAQSDNGIKPIESQIKMRHAVNVQFEKQPVFTVDNNTLQRATEMQSVVHNATIMNVNKGTLASLLSVQPDNIEISIPAAQGLIALELYKVNIFAENFSVITASNNQAYNYNTGVHYRGVVKGQKNTLAAISIFNDEVMGFVSFNNKNHVIGKMEKDANDRHIFYAERDLQASPNTACYTVDDGQGYNSDQLRNGINSTLTTKCVRLYWETNYDIFQGKGSVVNVTNYVTGIFNQSATIYTNDGISVTLSQVYVWDVASPYTATSTSSLLSQFKATRTSFNGDLGHLLGYAGGGGIAAGFSGICNTDIRNSMCYSGIQSSYSNVPTYSWSVEVTTHEQGHLLGSRHTHACVWNGNSTAIDGCSGATEGGCTLPGNPVGGGTIMSYCHVTSVGINFSLGFGPQPQAVIVNNINNGACLSICGSTACTIPAGLSTTNITPSSATFNWFGVSGATSYGVRYRQTGAANWINVSSNTINYNVSALTLGNTYEWQVRTICSDTSAYSTSVTFIANITYCSSLGGVIDGITNVTFNTINNTTSATTAGYTDYTGTQSTTVNQNSTYNLSVSINTGGNYTNYNKAWIDWNHDGTFSPSTEEYNLGSAVNVTNGLSSLCPLSIAVPASAVIGTTRMRVSSQYSTAPTPCNASFDGEVEDYSVVVAAAATCAIPTGLATTNITNTGVVLSWTSTGATTYNLQWKTAAAATYTTITGIGTNSYNLGALAACTAYNFRVQSVCGASVSAYSNAANFTTIGCGVNYCTSISTNSSLEYINRIALGTVNNTSGNNGGYGNFTALTTNLAGGTLKTITMVPGFSGAARKEAWKVYIDYNHNGVFTDAGENVVNAVGTGLLNRNFTVPVSALNGATRMRVQMKYTSYATNSCTTFANGEVEDYTVVITGNPALANTDTEHELNKLAGMKSIEDIKLYPNPAHEYVTVEITASEQGNGTVNIFNMMGEKVMSQINTIVEGENQLAINVALLSKGVYVFEMDLNGKTARQKFMVAD